jgi:predicted nucleotidyltransferase
MSWYEMGIILEARYRGMGYSEEALELLLKYAFEEMGIEAIHNYFEDTRTAAVRIHLSAGFVEYKSENGMIELLITKEWFYRQRAIKRMVSKIATVLSSCRPSIYLYGSVVLNDFQLGWSDIDILILTQEIISKEQADELVEFRQKLLQEEPGNSYYRSFEGGMLSEWAFINHEPDRVVYWGTSGQRITDSYDFDSFCMAELLERGVLLYGEELRSSFKGSDYDDLRIDVQKHYEVIRQYAQKTDRSFFSFGWLLDISRCIYTLRTGKVISKTAAGQWALSEKLCPVPKALQTALEVRRNPLKYKDDKQMFDYAERLGPDVQSFADVLEHELQRS